MNHRFITIPLYAVLFAGALTSAERVLAASTQQQKQQPKSQSQPSGKSLTGCVDEQESRYVLTDDRNLTPIANLEADGFPTEGFAKHVGHKVIVRGISISGDPLPVFKVRSIETISETCAPQR